MTDQIWQKIKETNRLGPWQISFFETIDSTNSKAAELAQNGLPGKSVVLAETQTKGRGRLDRSWQSPPGTGIYFSLIWRSHLAPEHLSKITLAAGLGLCKAIATKTDLAPMIKWPNDLFLDSKKIGGILTENLGMPQHKSLIIIGVGLNVNTGQSAFASNLKEKASSLYLSTGKTFDRGDLLLATLNSIESELNRLEKGEIKEVLSDFRKKDATLGRKMTWLTPAHKIVTGVSLGINDEGMLLVLDENGNIHEVLSGDLTIAGQRV